MSPQPAPRSRHAQRMVVAKPSEFYAILRSSEHTPALDPHSGLAASHAPTQAPRIECQPGGWPCPKGPGRRLSPHPTILAPLPVRDTGWSEDGVGFMTFQKNTNQASLAAGFSWGSWLFPSTTTCKHPNSDLRRGQLL